MAILFLIRMDQMYLLATEKYIDKERARDGREENE